MCFKIWDYIYKENELRSGKDIQTKIIQNTMEQILRYIIKKELI